MPWAHPAGNLPRGEKNRSMKRVLVILLGSVLVTAAGAGSAPPELKPDARIVLLGNGLGSRMMNYGHFETEMHRRFPSHRLFIRNICDEGDTPGYRPHSGRANPWAFDGAEKFRTLATARKFLARQHNSSR